MPISYHREVAFSMRGSKLELLILILFVVVTQPVCSPNDPALHCWAILLRVYMYALPPIELVSSSVAR